MASQRDGFPNATKEILAKRSGQRCSNPDCRIATSGPHQDDQRAINLGVAAHITAAAPGGPRYNPSMSPEDRSAGSNGIWLCQSCAKLIDSDTVRFPEALLIIWRRRHQEFIKTQMISAANPRFSAAAPGALNISAVQVRWPTDGRSCICDFRVSNHGGSDLMIIAVEFQVIEC